MSDACPGPEIYRSAVEWPLGRALSRLDAEASSPSRGSFDRTWWGWKFSDFSASRFQEGVYTLAWLVTSPFAPPAAKGNSRLVDAAAAAVHFWAGLQHRDGSFDEAYPFERSLAATAFTAFYVGCGIARLGPQLPAKSRETGLSALEGAARWLARYGEYHGVLSNHLAAAAAALQVVGDLLGSDRFRSARDRYIGIIYTNQDHEEGWLREYGGADPGYQSHAMFYLAEIWRRTGDATLLECLRRATRFIAWFAHPDGTLGGEYASRGTKFAYPAAFEMLAPEIPEAAAVAAHLRRCVARGRGVGPHQVDAWNLFPMLNNFLFAADAAQELYAPPLLPWQDRDAFQIFDRAGIAVARRGQRVLAAGLALGGTVKLWNVETGRLVYEDCGYGLLEEGRSLSSQSESTWSEDRSSSGEIRFHVVAPFTRIPSLRLWPWRFVMFRMFTLTLGRFHLAARALKQLLVAVLIRRKAPHPARLERSISFNADGSLALSDRVSGLERLPMALERQVPFHMGSARYADLADWMGAELACPAPEMENRATARRLVQIK